MRYDGTAWTVYTTEDGLIHNKVYDIAQTPDGAIWVGTLEGLSRFDGTQWTSFMPGTVTGTQKIRTLFVDRDGSLWIGQAAPAGGAIEYDGTTWTYYTKRDGLGSDHVWSIYQSRDGTLWFGTDVGLSRFDGVNWSTYPKDDVPIWPPYVRGETADGALWLGEGRGIARFVPDRHAPETVLEPAVDRVSSLGNILLKWSGHDLWNDTPPQALHYQWRTDGGDWSPVSDRADFTFTSLSSGRY